MLQAAGRKSSNAAFRRSNHDIHRLRLTSGGSPSLASLAGLNESCRATPDNRLLTTDQSKQTPCPSPMLTKSDFATNLIPIYPSSSLHGVFTRISTKRIGIRQLTTNNNSKNSDEDALSSSTPYEVHSSGIGKVTTEESASGASSSSNSHASSARDLVGSVGKRVNERLNVGDKLSVYGIVGLIGIVLASPFVVRYVAMGSRLLV